MKGEGIGEGGGGRHGVEGRGEPCDDLFGFQSRIGFVDEHYVMLALRCQFLE